MPLGFLKGKATLLATEEIPVFLTLYFCIGLVFIFPLRAYLYFTSGSRINGLITVDAALPAVDV